MNPRPRKLQLLQWFPSTLLLTTGPASDGAIYLTFDDGPHPQHTEDVLGILAANDAHASFFLLGEQVERHPDIVGKIVAGGHGLGNHSWDHPRFTRIPWSEQIDQIERTDRLLTAFDGRSDHRFRPPSGQFTAAMLARFAARRRNLAYWSYDSLDYQRKPLQQMVDVLREHPPRAGDIVLMHDDSETTSRALAVLVPEWRAAGLQMRALPEVGHA